MRLPWWSGGPSDCIGLHREPHEGGTGSIPDRGTKISHAKTKTQWGQKILKKKKKKKKKKKAGLLKHKAKQTCLATKTMEQKPEICPQTVKMMVKRDPYPVQ